jgi:hypothetical protein
MTNAIDKIRLNVSELKGNEAKAINENPSLADLFKKRQELLYDMNQACLKAMSKAKKPFLTKLEEIEKEYAFLLQFTADNKENNVT